MSRRVLTIWRMFFVLCACGWTGFFVVRNLPYAYADFSDTQVAASSTPQHLATYDEIYVYQSILLSGPLASLPSGATGSWPSLSLKAVGPREGERVGNMQWDRLRQLLVLDALFRKHGNGILEPSDGPNLGNIYILDEIFSDPGWFYGAGSSSTLRSDTVTLPDIFAYKRLLGGSGDATANVLSPGEDVTLGDALILKKILEGNPKPPF